MKLFQPKANKSWALALLGAFFLFIVFYSLSSFNAGPSISYTQEVQPILASKCYACHGPDEAEREAGLRLDQEKALYTEIESGNTALSKENFSQSEIIKRINSTDPDFQMPPPKFPKPLEKEEISLISQWVKDGANWENHWSFEPIDPTSPPWTFSSWPNNPIDKFILSKRKELGLRAAPKADKRTLIRRLSYDLHGLPPSPDAVEAFLKDNSHHAYEKLVDSMLASPRYGERWARYWLDVAHYGETHGYDKDHRRPNAWPYRDYVINAFNQDMPYSRFIEDQLAGDILHPEDPQSTVALGFLAAGPWDLVGHVEVKDGSVDKRIVRNLDRDDFVSSAMASFTGLTVQCARCHDHKFDPIKQADYYSLQAVFAGIDRADRSFDKDPETHQKRNQLNAQQKALNLQFDAFESQLDSLTKIKVADVIAQQKEKESKINQIKYPPSPNGGYHSQIEQSPDHEKWFQVDLGKVYDLDKLVFVPTHNGEGIVMPGYGFPVRFKVEISDDPDFRNATLIADYSKSDHNIRTDKHFSITEENMRGRYIRMTANKLWKGRGQDHFMAMAELQVFAGDNNVARDAQVQVKDQMIGKRWAPGFLTDGFDSWRFLRGAKQSSKQQAEIARLEGELASLKAKENEIRKGVLKREDQDSFDEILDFLAKVQDSLAALPRPEYVYAAATDFRGQFRFQPADSIRPIYRLNRGDTEQAQEEVGPGTVSTFEGLSSRFELPEDHSEGERRVALAQWMTDKRNAFTWRSIVNRVWQYHLGRGIVATPNDFGKMGAPPTHPGLLDYLAASFLENGQSLKWLHKEILMSATYQQAAQHYNDNALIDSENRFLWRANRRQLEAEAIRDAVLAVSGKLDLSMGGPGFDAFRYEDDHSPRYLYKDYDAYDPASFRRTIYRTIVRSVPDPFMSTLDCADPSQSVPVRNETVTALQALSTLNNPFMVRQAAFFAERLQSEADDLPSQLNLGFELALQRPATELEIQELEAYAEDHGLAAACRLIFGMSEFLYVD